MTAFSHFTSLCFSGMAYMRLGIGGREKTGPGLKMTMDRRKMHGLEVYRRIDSDCVIGQNTRPFS
jgi:hypothetical protein